MVKRRAVSKADKAMQPERLPLLYKTLVPLTADRQGDLYLNETRDYDYASMASAIPLSADEFAPALRSYPIVMAGGDVPTPVALVGHSSRRNDFVREGGQWAEGAYIPAYLRRYPFAFVRESAESDRNILCADLSSVLFETSGPEERALFTEGKPSQMLAGIMEFCNRYDASAARTRQAMEEAARLELFEESTVNITHGGKKLKVDGFRVISEEKLRALPDQTLADLARRGVLSLYTAHHLSMSNFASFGPTL